MKRGLCCVCAVLVCTALAFAGSPARPGVDQKTGQQAVTPTVAPTHQDSVAAFDMAKFTAMGGLSNHAPEGYISPSGTWPSAETGRAHEFECSPAAQPEGEPDCGDDYVDSYNGGCNSTPEAFQPPIGPGPILGTSGTYSVAGQSGYRDTDWYVYVATEPTKITWSATAEFPVLIFLIDGTQGCGGYVSLGGALADPCKTAVIEKCVPAGTYWLWVGPSVYEGVTCGAQYCAQLDVESCVAPDPIACPDDSFPGAWQLVYSEDEAWQLFVSNNHFPDYNPDNGILLYEHFKGLGSPPAAITNVHWWGVSATYNDEGTLVECPLDPGNFHVAFWAHNKVTNRPLYEPAPDCYGGMYAGLPAPLYEFDVTGENLTKTDTHRVYRILNDDGSAQSEFTLWSWGCNLPVPLTAAEGWLSIQNTDDCPFWWAASPGPPAGTGGVHVQETRIGETVTREDVDGDLSWCITTDSTGPFTGACCDTVAGVCRNTTSDDCVGNYEEWHGSQTCSQIQCPAEVWACCEGSPANCSMYELANCTGDWYRFYVCSSTDPGYDPNFFCNGVDNIIDCPEIAPYCSITCDSPSAFSRGLTGGYLYISWDRGPGDQRYVIDNFTGFTGSINRMKWWGNSTTVWDGPDCDFDNPAPFAVKFYHTSGSGPDYNNPAKSYDPIDVPYTDTGYVWTGSPEYGSIDCYIISLPSTYSPGSGTQWVSIASKSPDCDYIWAPGADGGTGQWFYDNGTCGPEPGARHRCFCLHTNLRTGACCDELTGTCTNSQQEPACLSAGGTFYPSKGCNQIPAPGCIAHTGACCDHTTGGCEITASAGCTGTGQIWLGKDTTCDQCCVVMCPPGATPEGEETCYDGYVDEYNMGCFTESGWSSDDFVVINDGETICGETGTFYATVGGTDGRRDLDFYRYELTDPCAVVQAKVNGEFQPDVWLMVGQCYTDTWCGQEQTYVLVYSQAAASPCGDAIASAPLTGPNIYYIMVSCYGAVGDVPCGTPYTLEIDKAPAGHCTIGEDSGLTSEAFCLALGGTWLDDCTPSETQKGDSNCDGSVNSFDIDPFVLALTDPEAWRAAYTCNYLDANDCNEDGVVNAFDIDPFVQCLTGGCK